MVVHWVGPSAGRWAAAMAAERVVQRVGGWAANSAGLRAFDLAVLKAASLVAAWVEKKDVSLVAQRAGALADLWAVRKVCKCRGSRLCSCPRRADWTDTTAGM